MLLTADARAQDKNLNYLEINGQLTPNLVLHFIASLIFYPVTAFHWDGILRPLAHSALR